MHFGVLAVILLNVWASHMKNLSHAGRWERTTREKVQPLLGYIDQALQAHDTSPRFLMSDTHIHICYLQEYTYRSDIFCCSDALVSKTTVLTSSIMYTIHSIWVDVTLFEVTKYDLVLLQRANVLGISFDGSSQHMQTSDILRTCNCALCTIALEPMERD
jgi:hypothetical protein